MSGGRRQALVTGTSRGIGAAVARALLERGWRVLGLARGAPAAGLERAGYAHERLDLADLDAVRAFFDDRLAERLELPACARVGLVHNAGTLAPLGPAHELELDALARAFAVNAIAPLWITGRLLRLAPHAALRVVDLSSGAATAAYPGWTAYCASKAALRMGSQVAALDLAESPLLAGRDVALVEYAPHVVATAMQAELRAADPARFPRRARFEELHEQGQLVAPEGPAAEIAGLLEADGLPAWQELRYRPPGR